MKPDEPKAGHTVNVAMEVRRTEAEGPGVRYALWTQGCPMRCPGCCNPEMLPFEPRARRPISDIVRDMLDAGVEGISLLGGEPFAQAGPLGRIAQKVKGKGLTVMVYSGYTLETLQAMTKADPDVRRLLNHTDLLVDGQYDSSHPETTRRWIGSSNQRMHYLTEAYAPGDPRMRAQNTVEIRLVGGELQLNGWPALGARTRLSRGRGQGPQHRAAHQLDEDEGRALDVARALVGARWSLPKEPITLKTPRAALATAASEAIAKGALKHLTVAGGHRERALLRGGERTHGRIWDEHLNVGFSLRYTKATEQLWRIGLRALPELLKARYQDQKSRRRLIRSWISITGTDVGDWLLFSMVWRATDALDLEPQSQLEILRRLAMGSPLVALCALERFDNPESLPPSLLLETSGVRLVECLEEHIVEGWVRTLEGPLTFDFGERGWGRRASALEGWLAALYRHERLDLARGVMRFLGQWGDLLSGADRGHAHRASQIATRLRQRLTGTSAQAQQAVAREMARVFSLGERLNEIRREMAAVRYGDPRYEEAQLYLSDHEQWFETDQHVAPEVARLLTGVVR